MTDQSFGNNVAAGPIEHANLAPSNSGACGVVTGQRRVMLLQGLMGPFFNELGKGLIARRHMVFKVNFNGGDRAYWRLPNGIDYRGTLENWPEAFTELLTKHQITDVMLFGDCRDHHVGALEICRKQNITTWIFEEGYIRPDWVTLENGGVNGYSLLSRDPEWYRLQAAHLPALTPHMKVPSSFRTRAIQGLWYNVADLFTRWHYPSWRTHRPWHPLVEGVGWARKLMRRDERRQQGEQLLARLTDKQLGYFLLPLQLDSDAQIRLHSPFAGMIEAIKLVLQSFAEHAPPDVRLVVKEHPLDNGVRDWQLETADLASRFGISDRVDYLAWGDIETIAENALGMVTVNSTSGTLALAKGVPVKVLGKAVYNVSDLTFQGDLSQFWTHARPPDPATFAAFRRVLIDKCLIPGGFFSEEALAKVVSHSIARFEGCPMVPD